MLVSAVVVADDVDMFPGGNSFIDHAQEFQPLLMTVALLAEVVDLAVGGVERGKQRGGAVALCVVLATISATLSALIVGVQPGRGASFTNPLTPCSRKRLCHRAAMREVTDMRSAICLF
jgi:hypothetical protein